MSDYFRKIFKSEFIDSNDFEDCIHLKLSSKHNEVLMSPISSDEVHLAVFSMHPDKAPSLDGFNPAFFNIFSL